MTEAYNNSFIASERVGKHTFSLLLNLLTKRGESKAGLSTYYINLRYCSRVFSNMMKRLNYFVDDMAQNDSSTLKNDITSIHDEWKRIQLFVMWELSNRHLKTKQKDPVHCCSYALKGAGNTIYNQHCCEKCSNF